MRHCLFLLSVALAVNTPCAFGQATFQPLGDLPGGYVLSEAFGVSDDGNVVVGYSHSEQQHPGTYEAFRWTPAQGITGLGDFPEGDFESFAWGVSSNGSVAVGTGSTANGREAFRWTKDTGMAGLGVVPGYGVGGRIVRSCA